MKLATYIQFENCLVVMLEEVGRTFVITLDDNEAEFEEWDGNEVFDEHSIKIDIEEKRKSPAAIMGALGGKKGGIARAKKLSPERRKEIAIKAANARWHLNVK